LIQLLQDTENAKVVSFIWSSL